jgi:hypothetical protein
VNLGFFRGSDLPDPQVLLEGNGRFMRHVKLRHGCEIDASALAMLIDLAYTDMKARLQS